MMMFRKFLPISTWLTKRRKFVLSALILAFGLGAIQAFDFSWRYLAIFGLTLLTYLLSAWSLKEGLSGVKWLTVLILPTFFTAGVGLFYFLLPARWLARLPVIILYGVGVYVLLLTKNIFTVAAIRTIQLLRSAQAVGFLFTLLTAFFLYDTIFSFRLEPWFNFFLVGLVSLPLFLAGLWSVNLEEKLTFKVWHYSLILSWLMSQVALAFSFWPVGVASGSLFLVTTLYVLLGLSQLEFSEKLFRRSYNEYLGVGLVILLIMILTTRWGS